mgnify:CR=1 FL=1
MRAGSTLRAGVFARGSTNVKIDVPRLLQTSGSRDMRLVPKAVLAPPPPPTPPATTPGAPKPAPAEAKAPAATPSEPKPAAKSAPSPTGRKTPTVVLLSSSGGAPGMPLNPVTPKEPPKPKLPWVFEGRIYDIISLEPVSNAQLVFTSGSRSGEATTDSDGRYRVELDTLPEGYGYSAKLLHPNYERYIDETIPPQEPLGKASFEDRRTMALHRASNKRWNGGPNQKMTRDLVAVPKTLSASESE